MKIIYVFTEPESARATVQELSATLQNCSFFTFQRHENNCAELKLVSDTLASSLMFIIISVIQYSQLFLECFSKAILSRQSLKSERA